ncbi:hypothetical protein GCM10023191_003730 [Actinoallomurus oryzae]|uniref:Uncharacterized protein n=1 Tax=Actinoallomurus oryzae TaxID=502180 RepID=A0ABP8PA93_9ACTN
MVDTANTHGTEKIISATRWTGTPAVTNVVFRHAQGDHGACAFPQWNARRVGIVIAMPGP